MLRSLSIFCCLSALAAPIPVQARSSSQISVQVPEHCELRSSVQVIGNNDESSVIPFLEVCNGGHGYIISAIHRPLAKDETFAFEFEGVRSTLDVSGTTIVAQRSGARFGRREIRVLNTELNAPLVIDLTMMAV